MSGNQENNVGRSGSVRDFLVPFFEELENRAIRYCVLHSYDALPDYVESDLDIAVAGVGRREIEPVLRSVLNDEWEILQRLWYDIPGCYYYVLRSIGMPHRWVAVDILLDERGIGRYGFSSSVLTDAPVSSGLFRHSEPSVEFCYKLVKRIRKGEFKSEDTAILNGLYRAGNRGVIERLLTGHFGRRGCDRILSVFDGDAGFPGRLDGMKQLGLLQLVRKRYASPLTVLRRVYWQLSRGIYRITHPSGLVLRLPEKRLPLSQGEQSTMVDAVGEAFRQVIFREKYRYTDSVLALSTSRLLIAPARPGDGCACLKRGYFASRRTGDNLEDATAMLVNTLRDRMLQRLDP